MLHYQVILREGHLEAFNLIFNFLWKNPNKMQVMDPYTPIIIYEIVFHYNSNWVEFYEDVAEEYPPQMPEPLGETVSTSTFVDSDYASKFFTRISHTVILLFVYNGLIKAFSKRHNTVESSTFG